MPRGGARPNSGPKPKADSRRNKVTLALGDSTYPWLVALAQQRGCKLPELCRDILDEYAIHHDAARRAVVRAEHEARHAEADKARMAKAREAWRP